MSLQDKLSDCLTQQISELELLKSMYPENDEIILTDAKILEDINSFLVNKSEFTPGHLDFVVNLHKNGLKLEICINLPSFYPVEEPDIYVRCNQLNRHQETLLNNDLSNYLKANFMSEVCLYTAISWLQDNIDSYYNTDKVDVTSNEDEANVNLVEEKFVRYWIYSHHIYNKKKREEITKLAKQLNLTGFCLPGKPGIVCIEGTSDSCKEWWRDIKSMCWKKIVIRKVEVFEPLQQKQEQKFDTFEEVHFANSSTKTNSKHADMSGFSKFMEERGLTQAFNDFFGLCNE